LLSLAEVLNTIPSKLSDLSDVQANSEKAYLLLDMLACPSIPTKKKSSWIRAFYKAIQKTAPLKADVEAFTASASNTHWQVNWTNVDLLNSLEKKELKQAY